MHALCTENSAEDSHSELRLKIAEIVADLGHVLPGQAPILNFVHHNTLHGFQHLPFDQALAEAERITGIFGYLPESDFRRLYACGRISDGDLEAVLNRAEALTPDTIVLEYANRSLRYRDVYRIAMVYGIERISTSHLRWSIEELGVLDRVEADVPPTARRGLLESIKHHQGGGRQQIPGQEVLIRELWRACLEKFGLDEAEFHPEELIDLSMQQAERLLGEFAAANEGVRGDEPVARRSMLEQAQKMLANTLNQVGAKLSLRGLLLELTDEDVLNHVRPLLICHCASFLDEGLAAWHAPNRSSGFYCAWRESMRRDWSLYLSEAPEWRAIVSALPEDARDVLIAELRRLGLPAARWEGYLTRIALELPGWSGMMNWRATHVGYPPNQETPVSLMDYLAVRLILDRIWLERVCKDVWGIQADLASLERYFRTHLSELLVRHALFRGNLPEYLAAKAQRLVELERNERLNPEPWRNLADMIYTWSRGNSVSESAHHTTYGSAWRLFRLAQHLGMTAPDLKALPRVQAERLLRVLDGFTPDRRAYLWLQAYERHYREEVFAALAANHGHGRWSKREERPEAQIIFCMDDREESIRRHLEELNPGIETLGAAGFFGVAMNWRGLDDQAVTPLCPIVVTPSNEVREVPRPDQTKQNRRHGRRNRFRDLLSKLVNHEVRRNLVSSHALIDLLAPGYLLGLIGKVFFPRRQNRLVRAAAAAFVPTVDTELAVNAEDDGTVATPENPRLGFTDAEQADHVTAFFHNTGLTYGFAPLVVLMGHGSVSQNNPHLAAYDCGACSGRHGGPNARAFAAMANRPEIRRLLAKRGIEVPEDTWFVGTEHDTCNEEILWFDTGDVPALLRPTHHKLRQELDRACRLSAHERCRRFASAPSKLTLSEALEHVIGRSTDFSQVRPELGHATNAAAFVGRRSMSQGVFFDRRVFLISYDPTQDPDGSRLEGILLTVGPVGAGINLEYYFSTVNNERFGCGTKVPHNVTGLFGVMEGTSGDLRTGLPRQMIEIHEAMRLLVVVEHKPDVLGAIYERQPPLRELIGNAWIQLATLDPDDGQIMLFEPGRGFVPREARVHEIPTRTGSTEWYAGHSQPLSPALIRPDSTTSPRDLARA